MQKLLEICAVLSSNICTVESRNARNMVLFEWRSHTKMTDIKENQMSTIAHCSNVDAAIVFACSRLTTISIIYPISTERCFFPSSLFPALTDDIDAMASSDMHNIRCNRFISLSDGIHQASLINSQLSTFHHSL